MSLYPDHSSQYHPGMTVRITAVLEEVGALELLAKNISGLSARELAENLHLEPSILEPLCDFVSINLPTVIKKEGTRYLIGEDTYDPGFKNRLYFLLAYEPVFSNLSNMLRGKIKYGNGIARRGTYLQYSSALYSKPAWQKVIDILCRSSSRTVIDLGCGSGEFLIHAYADVPLVHGLGIEIDPEAIVHARSVVSAKGLAERITIIEGDLTKPEEWASLVNTKIYSLNCAFIGITVWHELLSRGEEFFLDVLARYRRHFPAGLFITVEYDGFSLQELEALPQPYRERASLYQLVHILTGQGLPQPPSVWLSLFKKAGIRLQDSISVKSNNLTIYNGVL